MTTSKSAMLAVIALASIAQARAHDVYPIQSEPDVLALIQAPRLFTPVLSHDGKWVAYLRRRTSLAENGYHYAAVLRAADGSAGERVIAEGPAVTGENGGGFLVWSPTQLELALSVP